MNISVLLLLLLPVALLDLWLFWQEKKRRWAAMTIKILEALPGRDYDRRRGFSR